MERSSAKRDLGDGNTLSFTTTDTSDEIVSNTSIDCVADTEGSHRDIAKSFGKILATDVPWDISGSSCDGCELQSLAYTQHREMNIHFSGICSFATEILVHCLGIDSLVID